jgi:hypothetical protein
MKTSGALKREEPMSIRMILLPVFVHVALVFVLLLWGRVRTRNGARADERGSWRDEAALGALFYVLTICAWQTKFADLLFLLLAWIFVALRILGAVRSEAQGGPLFVGGAIVLAIAWAIYAVRLLLAL